MRHHAIGHTGEQLLLLVVFVDRSEDGCEIIQSEGPKNMSKERTPVSSRKGIKISLETREAYERRDKRLDSDPDTRPLPPEEWANAMRRDEFFRPVKEQLTVRLDKDVVAWLRSQGDGYQTRMNAILREAMTKSS